MADAAQLPPGPTGLHLVRTMVRFFRDALGVMLALPAEYGDVVHLGMRRAHTCLLSHPDHMRDVLVTRNKNFIKSNARLALLVGDGLFLSNGDFHRRQRRLMQPAFQTDRLTGYGAVMAEYAATRCARWQPNAELNIHREMLELTQTIVAKALLGTDLEVTANNFAHAMTVALESNLVRDRLPLPAKVRRWLGPSKRFGEARQLLDDTIGAAIADHKVNKSDDLLAMLLSAQDTEGGTGGLTDAQVRDEAVTLFMAGHETTAAALTWFWYVLAENPAVAAKVHAELDAVLAGRRPEVADLPRLPYLRQVVTETLRVYPPFWVLRRIAVDEFQVGAYTLPAGTVVLLNTWALHHDPRWYPEPWRIDPERMTPEAIASRDRYTFVPFAAGPRECIGEHFAWMEMLLVTATIAQQWQLRVSPGHTVTPVAAVSLRPKNGMPMIAEPRQRA